MSAIQLPFVTSRVAYADDAVQEPESSEIDETPDLPDDSELLNREYQGRSLRQWREVLKNLDHTNPSVIPEIPGLIEIMQDAELPWFTRRQVAITLARIGEPAARVIPLIVEHLASDDAETVNWAAKAIALYGPVGAPAATTLRGILEDDARTHAERLIAMEALARIGPVEPNVLPALIAQLQSTATVGEGLERKIAACDALALLRSGASPALPYLIRLLQSDSSRLRTSATVTIGTIGPAASSAIDSLVDVILFDEAPESRDAAAASLGNIGSAAIPALLVLTEDQEAEVRWHAASALARAPVTDGSVGRLHELAMQDDAELVRITAVESLRTLNAESSHWIPSALTLLESDDRQIRIRAYRLLLECETHADAIRPRLEELLRDERRHVRDAARRLMWEWERVEDPQSTP